MNNQERFKHNLSLIYTALSHDIYNEDLELVRDSFTKGFYEILKISFDINVSIEELERLTWSGKVKDRNEIAKLLIKTLENDSSYVLLNEYMEKIIEILKRNEKSPV